MNKDLGRPRIRVASETDSLQMLQIERAAQASLVAHGIDLAELRVPDGFEEPTAWTLAIVAEVDGEVVGTARLTELTPDLLVLDQVSVRPDHGGKGIGRRLLSGVIDLARTRGYAAITGTTFRDVTFNAPFYESLGCVEDPEPHAAMVQRRRIETALGLDRFGTRVIMRLVL